MSKASKFKKVGFLLMLTITMVFASCKKGFQKLNTNPNTSEFALPQALLAPAIVSVVSANMSRSQRINNELMQVTVSIGDTDGRIFRYEVRSAEADYLWNVWYTELTNFKDIYTGAEGTNNSSYKAVSLIMQAYVYSLLTDTYGDVPFSESNLAKTGNYRPKFDKQEEIYPQLLTMLEAANDLLKEASSDKNAITSASDPLFAGDRTKWRKFGNSLLLRLLLRISGKTNGIQIAKIKELIDDKASSYPVMESNDDSAILRWTGTAPYVSPFNAIRNGDWYGPKLGSFFVDALNAWSDPRIQKWATLYNGEYAGIESGYAVGNTPEPKSSFPVSLKTDPLLGNIMNYSELQFIFAEAAAKGWITSKSAKISYETGATSNIELWGFTVPNNYLTFDRVKYDENYSLDQKMELIHRQKYYALFFTDLEQWFEYRRTGHPVLPKGAGLANGGVMPARLTYPVYVQSANGANYQAAVAAQGADAIGTQVWWQRP